MHMYKVCVCACVWQDVGMVIRESFVVKFCGVIPTLFGCFFCDYVHALSFLMRVCTRECGNFISAYVRYVLFLHARLPNKSVS